MSQTADDLRDLQGDARAELARLRAKVERLMEERVTPALAATAEAVEDTARRTCANIEENAGALSRRVGEHPLLAVAVAALGGFLLGRLMGGTTHIHTVERPGR